MKHYNKWPAAVALVAVLGTPACRPWKHKSPEERAEWMAKRISKELELNDSQKQVLYRIKDEFIAKQRSERGQMQEQFKNLQELIRADAIDPAKLNELRNKHRAHRENMENFFVEKALEFHKVLTPQQRAKAADLMQKHFARFSGEK